MSDKIVEYLENPLWPILVEAIHTMPMYLHHKAYVRDRMLNKHPDMKPRELASALGISLGEALIIIYELSSQK
jgi:hypothetical protein